MGQKRVVVALADGFEEIEALAPVDILRRAGLEVVVAGVGSGEPEGAHGVRVPADTTIEKVTERPDAVVLPGGMPGAENLEKSRVLADLCRDVRDRGGLVAAICAAPAVALESFGLIGSKRFTCYPGFESRVKNGAFSEDRVVVDGNLVTSRGPGTAMEFALEIVRILVGESTARDLTKGLLLRT